ncbi:hypothetical protein OROMI_014211 [Orobanche minor]
MVSIKGSLASLYSLARIMFKSTEECGDGVNKLPWERNYQFLGWSATTLFLIMNYQLLPGHVHGICAIQIMYMLACRILDWADKQSGP